MLKTKFVPRNLYRVIIYARYSDENQNPRSIDQQIETIKREIKRQNLPWTIVVIYTDSAISGRKKRQRKGFLKMMADIKSGAVIADLVLVDTFERLSRAEDNLETRNKLLRMGLMVLTADSHFVDPTSPAGAALTFVEAVRSSEVGKAKAHDILRGKLDAVRLKHWPGGPVPFGLGLKSVLKVVRGAEEVDHKIVVIDPKTGWVVQKMFALADSGLGTVRIARRLNDEESIPGELKPFSERFVAGILDNTIYFGLLTWNCNCTGLINDVRIIQKNPESEWERIEEFCAALVSKEVWDRVAEFRAIRRERVMASRLAELPSRESIVPVAYGIALTYVLSGLVRCAHCRRAMVACSSRHTLKSGETKTYVNYFCPAARDGRCFNNKSIREDWLRDVVTKLILDRVFYSDINPNGTTAPGPTEVSALESNLTFQELMCKVQREFDRLSDSQPQQHEALQARLKDCRERQNSYLVSLGKQSLSGTVRELIEQQLEAAVAEFGQLETEVHASASASERFSRVLAPEHVAAKLNHFSTILAGQNISAMNLCLAQHIDSISCDCDANVQVRTCKLGALAEIRELLETETRREVVSGEIDSDGVYPGLPQRLSRRDTGASFEDDDDALIANEFSTDPHRFSGLSPDWFWLDEFKMPKREKWADTHALEVAQSRLSDPCGLEALAARFGKTKPTIMDALNRAKDRGVDATKVDARRLQPNWAKEHASEVLEYFIHPGTTMADAVKHFGKSDAWIRKAKTIGMETRGTVQPSPNVIALKLPHEQTDDAA